MHQQQQSPLFKLPAELRNAIYEFSFTVAVNERTWRARKPKIELKKAELTMPSSALLRTCKAINYEATGMIEPHAQEWKNAIFTVSDLDDDDLLPDLRRMSPTTFKKIRFIQLRVHDGICSVVLDLTRSASGWKQQAPNVRSYQNAFGSVLLQRQKQCHSDMREMLRQVNEACFSSAAGERAQERIVKIAMCLKSWGYM